MATAPMPSTMRLVTLLMLSSRTGRLKSGPVFCLIGPIAGDDVMDRL